MVGGMQVVRFNFPMWPPFPAKTWLSAANDPSLRVNDRYARTKEYASAHLPGAHHLTNGWEASKKEGIAKEIVHWWCNCTVGLSRSAYLARELMQRAMDR